MLMIVFIMTVFVNIIRRFQTTSKKLNETKFEQNSGIKRKQLTC